MTREALDRFFAEARAVARLGHPNIIPIFDQGEAGGRPYLVFEFADGGTLADALGGTCMGPREAAALIGTLASAVHFAHEAGVVHRDLKPSNVLLTSEGTVKVGDFGLSKLVDDDSGRTLSGQILGTPSYMAPEQALGSRIGVGTAADVYAMGAILYEALTGRPPFVGTSSLDTLRQVVEDEAVPPSRLRPRLPRDLETICLKCLEKDPNRRYETAAALADDLERFLQSRPIAARRIGPLGRARRFARRYPVPVGLAASLLLVFAIGTGVSLAQWRRAEGERDRARRSLYQALRSIRLFYENEVDSMMVEELRPYRKALTAAAVRMIEDLIRDLDQADDPLAERVRVSAYIGLTKALNANGEREAALKTGREALELAKKFVDREPKSREARDVLGMAFQVMCILDIGDEEKLEFLGRSNELYRGLAAEGGPEVDHYSKQMLLNAYNLGVDYLNLNRSAEAVSALEAGRAIFEDLARLGKPEDDARLKLVLIETVLCRAYRWRENKRWFDSQTAGERAVKQGRSLVKEHPDDFTFAWRFYEAQMELGLVQLDRQDKEGLIASNQAARETLQDMARRHGGLASRMAFVQGNLIQVDFNLLNGIHDNPKSHDLCREVVVEMNLIGDKLSLIRPLTDDQLMAYAYASFLEIVHQQTDRKSPALALYFRSIRLWKELDHQRKLKPDERALLKELWGELFLIAMPLWKLPNR